MKILRYLSPIRFGLQAVFTDLRVLSRLVEIIGREEDDFEAPDSRDGKAKAKWVYSLDLERNEDVRRVVLASFEAYDTPYTNTWSEAQRERISREAEYVRFCDGNIIYLRLLPENDGRIDLTLFLT